MENLEQELKDIKTIVNRIEVVLIGDKFEETGLCQEVKKNTEARKRQKWTYGVLIFIGTGLSFLAATLGSFFKLFTL